ncbi:MAG: sel1 repeat family protein [Chlorobiaceae bacterium]|nr:sel1 repeat family protein [Chlorobiaceae bacterium]NTV25248.1 sel1 repeat family protein [Chlorobiaceae bacterium]
MKKTVVALFLLLVTSVPARGDQASFLATKAKAEAGDPKAQNKLGTYYQLGLNTEQSDAEAVRWFRKAAEQGNGDGEFNLGEMYEKGRGVPVDREQALYWYKKACDSACKCGCKSWRKLKSQQPLLK